MVNAYFPYAKKEMGFDVPVTIVFESDQDNAKNPLGKTAYYDPSNYKVVLYTDNRHPKDVMRSLSHELVHHKQNCNGELEGITGEQGYAQTEHGHRIEEEAYSLGNTCFRNWEDSVKKQVNETTYSKRGKIKMNEEVIRNAIRKIINESPALKEYFESKTQLNEKRDDDKKGDDKKDEEETEETEGGEKPDFLDLDKDGDKKEPMKKAAKDKKKNLEEELDENCGCPDLVEEEVEEPQEEVVERKPLKEWYDNSIYSKLLKEYTGGKK
jgi:hypothetical protein